MANNSNQSIIARFLAALGLNSKADAGALGNLQVESHFDPTAYNAGEDALGIAQWEGPRRKALQAYAARTGGNERSLQTQLGYLATELRADPGLVAALNSAPTAGDAAVLWDQRFERSAGTTRAERIAAANAIAGGAQVVGSTTPAASIIPTGAGDVIGGVLRSPWLTSIDPLAGAVNSLLGDAESSVGGKIASFAANAGLKLLIVGAGAALVVAGIVHTTAPARQAVAEKAEQAAPLAAAAA